MNAPQPSTTLRLEPRDRADPLADATIAAIVGDWGLVAAAATREQALAGHAPQWRRITAVNQLLGQWATNAAIDTWPGDASSAEPEVIAPLRQYLQAAKGLPEWADPVRLQRAETIFMEYGPLSCTLLFCASLPECYVVPDLAAVLHVAGQLEQHTEYRIRATAAMIFPVMMKGGLSSPEGGGVAQILKVRLIHAMIRNLILRGDPAQVSPGRAVPALAAMQGSTAMHHAMFAQGWNTDANGLPCNQEELAYTLLTFGYVFLRGMRRLGQGLSPADEEAYLHIWNVVGHVLGIERALMPQTMDEAQAQFARLQLQGRAQPLVTDRTRVSAADPRPALGQALMQVMAGVIPWRVVKPFPVLLTRYLCGHQTARDLGLTSWISWLSRALFALVMFITRAIDATVRLFVPGFSISRFVTRVLGYEFITQLLLDQTRPLQLPAHVLNRVDDAMDQWHSDPKAPRWMNRLEGRLTTRGRVGRRRRP